MKHKITNYGIQKLLDNFTDDRSFYMNMGCQFTDMMYAKLESVKDTLIKKMEIVEKARQRIINEFVEHDKAVKTPIPGQKDAFNIQIKEDYIQEANVRIAEILNTEVVVDLEDFTIEEFEEVLGKKESWRLSVPNRKFIDLLCTASK